MVLIKFNCPWLYGSLGTSALSHVLGHLFSDVVANPDSIRSTAWLSFFLMIFSPFLDFYILQKAIRAEPFFHLGYSLSVVTPVVLFYGVLAMHLICTLRAVLKGPSLSGVRAFVPSLFFVLLEKCAFALAHASPAAGILVAAEFFFVIFRLVFLPDKERYAKPKDE